ncbi:hypothetical protein [Nitrospira sp. Nam74]
MKLGMTCFARPAMWIILALCTVTLDGCASRQPPPEREAQPTTQPTRPEPRPTPPPPSDSRPDVDTQRLSSLIDRALPKWSEGVLTVRDGQDWTATLDFRRVAEAMGDDLFKLNELPPGITEVADKERSIRLVPQAGKVRYLNRSRAWDSAKGLAKAIEEKRAVEVVEKAMSRLGMPLEEAADARINTQMAAGAPAGSEKIRDQYEMARIVAFPRTIANVPIYNSRVMAAVSNEGIIERFQAVWPTFRLKKELALLDRQSVIKQIAEQIARQNPDADLKVQAYLAYAPMSPDDEEPQFVPSVIVSVYAKPTPYQLVVPVAQMQKQTREREDKTQEPPIRNEREPLETR